MNPLYWHGSYYDKGQLITGSARRSMAQEMRRLYEDEGMSTPQIAEEFSRSYGFVWKLLQEAGTSMRCKGTRARKKVI